MHCVSTEQPHNFEKVCDNVGERERKKSFEYKNFECNTIKWNKVLFYMKITWKISIYLHKTWY